jgi:hypothetical protein
VKETSVCIVDEAGTICKEVKVTSHPDDLIAVLSNSGWRLVRIGLEAGPLSQWLFEGLANAGLPAVCIETRHTKAFLKATVNKTDRNDARGIAQMMRVNLFRPVHVKTVSSQQRRALLTARKLISNKARDIENDIRGLLRNFGLKVGVIGCELVLQLGYGSFLKVCPTCSTSLNRCWRQDSNFGRPLQLCTEDCYRSFETMRPADV